MRFTATTYGLLLAMFGLLVACGSQPGDRLAADFDRLRAIAEAGEEQTVGVFGGSARTRIRPVETREASFRVKEQELQLDLAEDGYFQCTPAAIGLPESWFGLRTLHLEVIAERADTLLFEIYGTRSRQIDTIGLHEGRLEVALDITEVPLLGGIEAKPSFLRISTFRPHRLAIRSLELVEKGEPPFLVDRWGQRARSAWPGKVGSREELLDTRPEQNLLASLPEAPARDAYGGFLHHQIPLSQTGFFHTQYAEGRWWLVTPEGNPFYSLGVNGVRIKSIRGNADVSRVAGREWLFETIPEPTEAAECFREEGKYFSFYCWNVLRKYGNKDNWQQHTYERLRRIGFNTIGNWSDTVFYNSPRMPYTYTLDTRRVDSLLMENGLPDVFHPAWEDHLARTFAEVARFREDPFLLGYFVDNEMPWRSLRRLDDSHTGRRLAGMADEDARAEAYADRYFQSVRAALLRYDSNHLYLGCRFTRNFRGMAPIAEAAGQQVDVLSINVYSAHPIREQIDQWYAAAGKPVLIGEHHIPPVTPKQLLPHWPAFATETRNAMVKNYIYTWMDFPYAVGSHWYQYKDQEVAGRGDGGENQPVGLVTVTDKLNEELVSTYAEISREIPRRLLGKANALE